MSYTTNLYADVQQVYNALDLTGTTTIAKDSAWVQELLVEAQQFIDTRLGFSFQTDGTISSPATRYYDGNPDDMRRADTLFIGSEHIISAASVSEVAYNVVVSDGVYVTSTTVTTDITADCILQPNNSPNGFWKIKRKSGIEFQAGVQNYKVTGIFGRPSVPLDISRACVRIAVHYYKMRDTNYAEQIMEQGMIRLRYSKEIEQDILEIIDAYRPRVFVV